MRDSSPLFFRSFGIPSPRHLLRRRRGATVLQRWLGLAAVLCAAAPPTVAEQVERWTLEQTLVIGEAMDEERGLTRVGSVAVAGDRLYVGQPQESRIRVFTTEGDFVGFIGRRGEGPGEFRNLGKIGAGESAVWAADRDRLTSFDADHAYVSSLTVRIQPSTPGARFTRLAGLADGSLLMGESFAEPWASSGEIRSEYIFRLDREGVLRDTVAAWERVPSTAEIEGGIRPRIRSYVILPVRDASLWNLPSDGFGFVLVHRRSATRSGLHTYQVIRFGVDADTVFARQFSYDPIPISDAFLDREVDRVTEDGEDSSIADMGAYRRALREAFGRLGFFPPVERIHAGTEGTTWLELRIADEEFEWEVLDRTGEPLGRFRAPEGARMVAGDLEGAWFVEHDELDIPYLVRYDFVRPD